MQLGEVVLDEAEGVAGRVEQGEEKVVHDSDGASVRFASSDS